MAIQNFCQRLTHSGLVSSACVWELGQHWSRTRQGVVIHGSAEFNREQLHNKRSRYTNLKDELKIYTFKLHINIHESNKLKVIIPAFL